MDREIFKDNEKSLTVSINASEIDSLRSLNITKTGIRVYDKGFIGVSGAAGGVDENELYKKAVKYLDNKISYPFEISSGIKKTVDIKNNIMDEKDFMNECEAVLDALKKRHSNFTYFNKIRLIEKNTEMTNTKGLSLKHSENVVSFEMLFKEKSSLNIFDGFVGYAGRKYNRKNFIDYAGETLEAYNDVVDLPKNGTYPVAFSMSGDNPTLNIFNTELNGTVFGAGGSLFSGKAGQKLFSDDFTLYQTHNPEDVLDVPFFDMEGTVNDDFRYDLIENGILKTPYTDKRTAKMYNLVNTGNAAGEYDDVPTLKRSALQSPNLTVKAGSKTAEQLFGGEKGILVVITSGGDFNSSGDFGAPVQLAFLYDGKKIIGRLPQLSISSNVYKMFGDNFRGVSSDLVYKDGSDRLLVMDAEVSKM